MSFWNPQTFYCGTPYNSMQVEFSRITLSTEEMRNMLCIPTNNNEKETKKMEAKKCDRCGKLYEMKDDKNDMDVCYKYSNPFFTGEAARYSEEYIKEKMSKLTFIKTRDGDVDLCPDCRESFKRWFENG